MAENPLPTLHLNIALGAIMHFRQTLGLIHNICFQTKKFNLPQFCSTVMRSWPLLYTFVLFDEDEYLVIDRLTLAVYLQVATMA